MMLDQTPQVATEEHCRLPWSGGKKGARFRCYLCGRKFVPGDAWRFVFGCGHGVMNFLVCEPCDGPDVLARWKLHVEEGERRFWWMARE